MRNVARRVVPTHGDRRHHLGAARRRLRRTGRGHAPRRCRPGRRDLRGGPAPRRRRADADRQRPLGADPVSRPRAARSCGRRTSPCTGCAGRCRATRSGPSGSCGCRPRERPSPPTSPWTARHTGGTPASWPAPRRLCATVRWPLGRPLRAERLRSRAIDCGLKLGGRLSSVNPRAEATERLAGRYDARVLEPSPPAVTSGPWFADDPVDPLDAPSGRPVVSPVATAETHLGATRRR